ncbi:MAG: hypothetical protein AAGI28_04585 [Pseudomonadota bacterium]
MDTPPRYLPVNLKGLTAGIFQTEDNLFLDDVVLLGGEQFMLGAAIEPDSTRELDYFLLDMRSELGPNYAAKLRNYLKIFGESSNGRQLYAAIPYIEMNYHWDVHNDTIPSAHGDAFPGPRHLYDDLMAGFAVRSISNLPMEDKIRCMVLRLTPLSRTVVCVTAASGQGKTTFVRQLKRYPGSFHVASDYLLSSIIGMKDNDEHSQQIKTIKASISGLDHNGIWSSFFRMIEKDDQLLYAFLDIVLLQLETATDKQFVSFDIDAREEATQLKIKRFFEENGLKAWMCTT